MFRNLGSRIKLLAIMVIIFTMILSSCSAYEEQIEENTPTTVPKSTVVDETEQIKIVDQEPGTEINIKTLTLLMVFQYLPYNQMWEYLEWGNTVEYCHPEFNHSKDNLPYVELQVEDLNGNTKWLDVYLRPPQYRTFLNILGNLGMIYYPGNFSNNYPSGYTADLSFLGGDVPSIINIKDPDGSIIWNFTMVQGPRELNALESEYLAQENLMLNPWDSVRDFTDIDPENCPEVEWFDKDFPWSPIEVAVRNEAAHEYFKDASNNAWRSSLGSIFGDGYGIDIRWVDSSGNVLTPIEKVKDFNGDIYRFIFSVPPDGWVTLQSKEDPIPCSEAEYHAWIDNIENIPWETKLKILVNQGDYLSVATDKVINDHKSINHRDPYLYKFTVGWEDQKILDYFLYDKEFNTNWFYW